MGVNLTVADYISHHLHHWHFSDVNVDSLIMSWILGITFVALFYIIGKKASVDKVGGLQNALEHVVEFVDLSVRDTVKKESDIRWVGAIAFTLFIWILFMNLMDLVPVDFTYIIMQIFGLEFFCLFYIASYITPEPKSNKTIRKLL